MATVDATQSMINSILGQGTFWHCGSAITSDIISTGDNICRAGLILAFGVSLFQFILILYKTYSEKRGPLSLESVAPLVFKTLMVGVLLSTGLYTTFVQVVIAAPADAIASFVTQTYYDSFMTSVNTLFTKLGSQTGNPIGILVSTVSGSLVTTLVAGAVLLASMICLFLGPFLQSTLFIFVYYIGPVCLAFWLCDFTSEIAKRWLSFALTIAWMGFFGSVAFLVVNSLGFLTKINDGVGWNDFVVITIYGVISIVLFMSAWPITSFIFGALGSMGMLTSTASFVGGMATGTGATIAAGGAGVAGSGVAMKGAGGIVGVAGTLMQRISKDGGTINKIGGALRSGGTHGSSIGDMAFDKGAAIYDAAKGSTGGKNTAAAVSRIHGSSDSKSAVSTSQTPDKKPQENTTGGNTPDKTKSKQEI